MFGVGTWFLRLSSRIFQSGFSLLHRKSTSPAICVPQFSGQGLPSFFCCIVLSVTCFQLFDPQIPLLSSLLLRQCSLELLPLLAVLGIILAPSVDAKQGECLAVDTKSEEAVRVMGFSFPNRHRGFVQSVAGYANTKWDQRLLNDSSLELLPFALLVEITASSKLALSRMRRAVLEELTCCRRMTTGVDYSTWLMDQIRL